MPKELNLEMKVGAFVVTAILALTAFVFSISDFSVFQKGTSYTVMFRYANGLKKGAPVRLAGVDAGHVKDLKVAYDTNMHLSRVAADIWLSHGILIAKDSSFLINQLGLMGEKYLEILPGTSTEQLSEGSTVIGEDPVSMEAVMGKISGIADKVEAALKGVNDGLLSETNKKALTDALGNIAVITDTIKRGDGTLGMLLKDKTVYEDLAAIISAAKNGEGTVGMLLKDKSIYQNLDEMTADLKTNPWKLFYRPKGK